MMVDLFNGDATTTKASERRSCKTCDGCLPVFCEMTIFPLLFCLSLLFPLANQLWNAALNDSIQPPHHGPRKIQGLHNVSWLLGTGAGVMGDSYSSLGDAPHSHQFH